MVVQFADAFKHLVLGISKDTYEYNINTPILVCNIDFTNLQYSTRYTVYDLKLECLYTV